MKTKDEPKIWIVMAVFMLGAFTGVASAVCKEESKRKKQKRGDWNEKRKKKI